MFFLWIAVGGAIGAIARFVITGWVQARTGFAFPWGTLIVNILGSMIIGAFLRFVETYPATEEIRAFVVVGLLGAFTTFSTFSYEIVALLQTGEVGRALSYSVGSLVLGIIAVYAGICITGWAVGARG